MTHIQNKISNSLLALCAALILAITLAFASVAYADEPAKSSTPLEKPYTYTITLSAGDGTIDGQTVETFAGLANGQQVDLSAYLNAIPNDSRYYVKGVRLAGRDNSDAVVSPVFNVTGDAQYVVAYGLKKDQVAYTINYVDEAGNQLAESATYYGNVGDKPVVAFRYIDNYLPNAYNMTGTLSADEGENVFTFVYRSAPGVTYTTVPGEAAAGEAAAPADAAAAVAAAAEAGEIIGEDGNPLAAPEDLVTIDDDENPLAPIADESEAGAISPAAIAGIAAGVLALFILAALLLMRRKRKNQAVQR